VSTIEYQCTRSGIRNLLSRSINNSPANLIIDKETGNITFKTAVSASVNDGNQPPAGGAGALPVGVDQGGGGGGQRGGSNGSRGGTNQGTQIASLQQQFTDTKKQLTDTATQLVKLQAIFDDPATPAKTKDDAKAQIAVLKDLIVNLNKRLTDLNAKAGGVLK